MEQRFSTGINNNEPLLTRYEKEKRLNQTAKTLWFTGLSGSGKSTIAFNLETELHKKGYITQLFDGDVIRNGLNKDLGFSIEDREENIRRIAEMSKIFLNCGIIVINCFVSPTIKMRDFARQVIGSEDFIEIFINTPIEVCEQRDVKGLYKKARQGLIKDFTGISSPYEAPTNPEIEIAGDKLSIKESITKILDCILPKIKFND